MTRPNPIRFELLPNLTQLTERERRLLEVQLAIARLGEEQKEALRLHLQLAADEEPVTHPKIALLIAEMVPEFLRDCKLPEGSLEDLSGAAAMVMTLVEQD